MVERLRAALSYYTLFSIAPLLVIVIAIAGYFFGADAVRGVVFDQLSALMGEQGADAVREMLARANDTGTAMTSSFGAAGSLAVVMIWVYYASQIFLFGAELTRAYAETHGSRRGETKERRRGGLKAGRRRIDGATPPQPMPA